MMSNIGSERWRMMSLFRRCCSICTRARKPNQEKRGDHKAIDDAVRLTYKLCLYRSATEDDVSFWQGLLAKDLSFPEMLLAIGDSK